MTDYAAHVIARGGYFTASAEPPVCVLRCVAAFFTRYLFFGRDAQTTVRAVERALVRTLVASPLVVPQLVDIATFSNIQFLVDALQELMTELSVPSDSTLAWIALLAASALRNSRANSALIRRSLPVLLSVVVLVGSAASQSP